MADTVWRKRAPLWLRILAGVLLLPVFALLLFVVSNALGYSATPLMWFVAIAAALAWLILYRAPTGLAASLLVLPLIGVGLILFLGNQAQRTFEDIGSAIDNAPDYTPAQPATPGDQAEAPRPEPAMPPRETPSTGDGYHYEMPAGDSDEGGTPSEPPKPETPAEPNGPAAEKPALPNFPWPPPKASATYVLPDQLLESYRTLGAAAGAILAALEQSGYVERSFYRTDPGGIALVTRLERINDDGSPAAERWPPGAEPDITTRGLLEFLRGLFYVDPGHYRVIVFVFQDLPFSQSQDVVTAETAHAWLTSGANVLPADIAELPFAGAHVTALIYEFASDGSKVQPVASGLTGKQHLEKAGLLAALDRTQ
ncbi:MAG TPA: hypothetical protein VNJ31_11650 [Methyloceanibacter sp.]|nr:hypothetical protein [Methyloceanibacter sp.]